MAWFTNFARSTVGAKIIMAVTGLGLVGFVLAHMAGNLLIFTGTPDAINAYAQGLKDLGPLLWVARIGLIVFAVLHIASFLRLGFKQCRRPQGYAQTKWQQAPSITLRRLSGIVVLAFIVYHLLHFTAGVVTVDPDGLRLATEDALTASFIIWSCQASRTNRLRCLHHSNGTFRSTYQSWYRVCSKHWDSRTRNIMDSLRNWVPACAYRNRQLLDPARAKRTHQRRTRLRRHHGSN